MHTEAQPTDDLFPPAPTPAERRQLARHHAALFPTRLALARWQHGGHLPHLHSGFPALRAAWYGTARRDFQAWLDRGGFTQHEDHDNQGSQADAALPMPAVPVRGDDTRHLGSCI